MQQIEQMLLQGADLDEIVDAHRVLLAEPVQASDALLDLHRIPGQIEIDEPMTKLKVAPLSAAAGEQEGAARFAKRFGQRLAFRRRRLAVDDEHGNLCLAQSRGQRRLRLEELREDHHASFAASKRKERVAFSRPAGFGQTVSSPIVRRVAIGELFERIAPGGGAAAGGLQQ